MHAVRQLERLLRPRAMKQSVALLTFALGLTVMLGVAAPAVACPSCQAALATDGGNYTRGLFWSILFMLSMPFAITSCFGVAVYRCKRRLPDAEMPREVAAAPPGASAARATVPAADAPR